MKQAAVLIVFACGCGNVTTVAADAGAAVGADVGRKPAEMAGTPETYNPPPDLATEAAADVAGEKPAVSEVAPEAAPASPPPACVISNPRFDLCASPTGTELYRGGLSCLRCRAPDPSAMVDAAVFADCTIMGAFGRGTPENRNGTVALCVAGCDGCAPL